MLQQVALQELEGALTAKLKKDEKKNEVQSGGLMTTKIALTKSVSAGVKAGANVRGGMNLNHLMKKQRNRILMIVGVC